MLFQQYLTPLKTFLSVEEFCLKSRTVYQVFRTPYSGFQVLFSVNGRTKMLKIQLLLALTLSS